MRHGSSGSAACGSKSSGTTAEPGRPDHWLPVHPVHPERPGGLLVEVEADQVPPAAAEPQQGGRHMTRVAAVVEGHRRPPAHCVVEHRQGGQRGEVGERLHPRRGRQAQAPQRIAATRIAEVDPGYGKVQRRLLVGCEIEIGQVEVVGSDEIPDLLASVDGQRADLDAAVAQGPLVALERLAPRFAFGRDTRVPRRRSRAGASAGRRAAARGPGPSTARAGPPSATA